MKLDKRIKALTDIQSVTDGCHDWQFMTKKGYFAESITEFENLKKCVYAEYIGYREHERCFHYWDEKDGKDYTHYARYFIPEDSLLPEEKPEKKYRPYTKDEFLNKFECGKPIIIRHKDDCINVFIETMSSIRIDNFMGDVYIHLYEGVVDLQRLFDEFEWQQRNGDWQPFGIEIKEE